MPFCGGTCVSRCHVHTMIKMAFDLCECYFCMLAQSCFFSHLCRKFHVLILCSPWDIGPWNCCFIQFRTRCSPCLTGRQILLARERGPYGSGRAIVLELMQMHPKERLGRVILTASWFNDINMGYRTVCHQNCLSPELFVTVVVTMLCIFPTKIWI